MRQLYVLLVPVAALVLVGGCSSTPPSRFYTLSAAATPVAPASELSAAVGPVSVPAQVDRPQFVVRTGPNQVQLDEFNRWAAPLQDNISRVVAENLVSMLGSPHITLSPQTLSGNAEYRIAIEVQGFESAPGESAMLDAVWTVRRMHDGKTETGRSTVREPVKHQGYDALAAAHSRAIAHMSQDIAGALRKLERVPVPKSDTEPASK